ncbi:ATP-binding protein [Streptomyces sp. NPDC059740]|uniref:ATP-binding protein n=1 Tax=Streptomyces sp. NPDC059740 TaxID=3346926 RepID=UPI003660CFDF
MRTPSGPPADPPSDLSDPAPDGGVWRFTTPALDSSVPETRHAVRALLDRQRIPVARDIRDGLLLIVSELVTNAVRHAALLSPTVAVEVAVKGDWVRVAVEDEHPYRPKALEATEHDLGGRGLWLVKMVAEEAGGTCDVERTASGGKAVWAELPLFPDAAAVTSPPHPR